MLMAASHHFPYQAWARCPIFAVLYLRRWPTHLSLPSSAQLVSLEYIASSREKGVETSKFRLVQNIWRDYVLVYLSSM